MRYAKGEHVESATWAIGCIGTGCFILGICVGKVHDAWLDERLAIKEWERWQAAHAELKDNAKIQ